MTSGWIGAPFKSATFTVIPRNQAKANYVVTSVKLNGVELAERRIRQADIVKGGTLEFEMSAPMARSRRSGADQALKGYDTKAPYAF